MLVSFSVFWKLISTYIFERGEALVLLCYSSWGVGGQPARGFPSESAVFRPMCVAEKRCLAVASAGHHPNSRWCGPDLTVVACHVARSIYLRRCGVDRDLSIETAPGGCDGARIKLHYGSMKGGRGYAYVSPTPARGAVRAYKVPGCPPPAQVPVNHRRVTLRHAG